MQLNPYLTFNGQCEAAFKFYEKCLGGTIVAMLPYEGTPAGENASAEWGKKILHVLLTVGDNVLMGSDAPPQHYQTPQGFSISLGFDDPADAERIFNELVENGTVQMPMQQTFWSLRFGMLIDQFGIPWIINCNQAS